MTITLTTDEEAALNYAAANYNEANETELTGEQYLKQVVVADFSRQEVKARETDPENLDLYRRVVAADQTKRDQIKAYTESVLEGGQ